MKQMTNSESTREKRRMYYDLNKERICEKVREWALANPERKRENHRRWAAANPEKKRESNRKYVSKWRADNPEKKREKDRKTNLKKYGLTPDGYTKMFAAQGAVCAACESSDSGSKNGWHVDHCHTTKKARGILCHSCNVALGQAKDSSNRLRKLAAYRDKFGDPT